MQLERKSVHIFFSRLPSLLLPTSIAANLVETQLPKQVHCVILDVLGHPTYLPTAIRTDVKQMRKSYLAALCMLSTLTFVQLTLNSSLSAVGIKSC